LNQRTESPTYLLRTSCAMPNKPSKSEQIKVLLERGVDSIYPSAAALKKRLEGGKKLKVYYGIDPTGADIHLGHVIPLRKLRQFQELGHQVVLLVGDFTGQTGDPTDKAATRVPLTKEQVLQNAKKYQQQAARVLDFEGSNPVQIEFNSKWLEKLTLAEVAELCGHFTVQQFLERDMFERRLKANKPISLREFLYPLMQGYDSVKLGVDVEVGGTDQTFNMLAGRKLAKELEGKDKFVITSPLLADKSGKKIGKSEGNAIAIDGDPATLYGQVMGLPDDVIVPALEWTTGVPQEEVAAVAKLAKTAPRDAKMLLAYAVVEEYHGEAAARAAESQWGAPTEELVREMKSKEYPDMRHALVDVGLAASLSEAARKIDEGAVRLEGERVDGYAGAVSPEGILSVGKKPQNRVRLVR
jgi:tyrosyl-tRNA synthetase